MKTSKLTIILSVALAIVLAFAVYSFINSQSRASQIQSLNSQLTASAAAQNLANLNITNTKADVFDAKLHDLLQEHTFLLINTIRRSLDSSASYNASLVALQNNINEVGALLTPIYGTNAQQLVTLWNTKTMIFINYSIDIKNGNPQANSNFNTAIAAYEINIATFWQSAAPSNPYPNFDYNTMLQVAIAHANNIKSAVDYWNVKDYTNYFVTLEVAYNQMGTYADIIAQGIITQNPTLFQ
jgi:hypothetical protein